MLIRRIATSLSLISVIGCSDVQEPVNTVPMRSGHAEIASALVNELAKNGDWYRMIDRTTIEIEDPAPGYVVSVLEEKTLEILPTGRSLSIGVVFRDRVYGRLSENGIEYRLIEFDNDEWIVWGENDSKAVKDIIDSATNEVLEDIDAQ